MGPRPPFSKRVLHNVKIMADVLGLLQPITKKALSDTFSPFFPSSASTHRISDSLKPKKKRLSKI